MNSALSAVSAVLAFALAVPGPGGLAGSEAGVGRAHPGRGVAPVVPHAEPVVVPGPVADAPPQARRGGVVLEVLPLGLGFTLMGVGLGFIGLSLRRGLLR